jgi:hypothetical protein
LRILNDASGKPKTGFVWTFGAADAEGKFDVASPFKVLSFRERLAIWQSRHDHGQEIVFS